MRKGEITNLQGDQFTPTQGSIVGEKEHESVSQRLLQRGSQDGIPLITSWYPGKLLVVTENAAFTSPSESTAWCEFALPNRIALIEANVLINEIVIQQPDH